MLVISPADPGSLGDAAMIGSVVKHYSGVAIDITAWQMPATRRYAGTRSVLPVSNLKRGRTESALGNYARLGCLGADVMDGLYAYADSCLRLRLLDLGAAMGLESRLFGFSFSDKPHPLVVEEFRHLHREVVVCVRDPISLQRLSRHVDRPLRLVADLAFQVEPIAPDTPNALSVLLWLQEQRQRGLQVIGLNVHPMFSFDHGAGITQALVRSVATLIEQHPGQAFVLIPHDFRPVFGDLPTLEAIASAVKPADQARVRLVTDIQDPASLKGFVAHLDGVLTGRMHLAIAALGQRIPVAGITYQGKFEGLLQHFSLAEDQTVAPPEAADPQRLRDFFGKWLRGLDNEAATIKENLPRVLALSALNFA